MPPATAGARARPGLSASWFLGAGRLAPWLLVALTFPGGCAWWAPTEPLSDAPVELEGVPFFPQRAHHCGPAALATVLGANGVGVHPDALAAAVYLPGRQGALQVEMLAAARRHGFMAVPVDTAPASLLGQLRHGRPVLVLQNQGLEVMPVWHYAVVVGYLPEPDRFVLRSGRERREQLGRGRLAATLERAGDWAVVLVRPGAPPDGLDPDAFLGAAADLENTGAFESALAGFRAAVDVWPELASARLGVANNLYYLNRLDQAETAYRALLAGHPDHVVAVHNLSTLLLERGRPCEAAAVVAAAPALTGPLMETARRAVAGACPGGAGRQTAAPQTGSVAASCARTIDDQGSKPCPTSERR